MALASEVAETVNRRHHVRLPRVGRYLPPFGDEFASVEALGGLALLLGTVAALVWANVGGATYADAWSGHLDLSIAGLDLDLSWRHWINDALMAIFFFVVALEIKREIVDGELRDPRRASLPALAAIGGMVLPAAIYAALNTGGPGGDGWAIPMATDIAFAVGVLALLGSRVPSGARLFLLTLAIVDDLGAILVIAVFYTADVRVEWLVGVAVATALVLGIRRLGVTTPWVYLLPALPLWISVHETGIHATFAGVLLGFLVPAQRGAAVGPAERLERSLHPWSSFAIVPVFALANAGVVLDADALEGIGGGVSVGIVAGLVVGKILGISALTALGVALRIGRLPPGVSWRDVVGVSAVAGIGFTVSLFVAGLSFTGPELDTAKVAILAASVIAGIAGASWFAIASRGVRAPRGGAPTA